MDSGWHRAAGVSEHAIMICCHASPVADLRRGKQRERKVKYKPRK